ncbi:IclR family transcriptional regulator [Nocardioides insulae]|uniref:IclR family transcriptional regulator n=1 Tax=Nocardioides insulae TaxID=394734 RepID=UPI0005680CB1|nr:IclR family transcriptional regulator [Nocardioides insulae]
MRSLDRAIDVLEVLEAARAPIRLSEVARRAGLHVATTQRILNALEERGRVEHDEAGYRTGVAMLFGAHAYLATNRVAAAAPIVLQQLAASTGLTSSVFVRAGISRAVVARIQGDDPLRYVLPIGERLPLYLGAGKVLAAYMDWDALRPELEDTLGRPAFIRANGVEVTLDEFHEELKELRTRGWVESRDERVSGASSVGAPVLTSPNVCVAAIQVAGPSRNPAFEDPTSLGDEVHQAASALAARLG